MDEAVKISAVVITFNEEKNIARCLDSLKFIADELLIVDSYSTDRTVEICHNYNVKIIQNKFEGHIEQKNFAMKHAANNIILSLDADEVLSDILTESIANVKNKWQADAYEFNRITNYCGKWIKHSGWYPDTKIRLWDRRKGKWGGKNPHDRVEMYSNTKPGFIKGDLLHYSYYTIKQHIDQVNYFTGIMSQEAFQRGKTTNLFFILLSPYFKFMKSYFFKMGFLDGYYGLVICIISAHATFLKHIKLKELYKKSNG